MSISPVYVMGLPELAGRRLLQPTLCSLDLSVTFVSVLSAESVYVQQHKEQVQV